jgi:hypothetical protein
MKAAEGKRGGIIGSLDSSADERIHSKALALAWLPWCCWFLAQWREMTRSRALVALKRLGTRARSVRTRENAVLSLARGVTALTKRESMLHSLCSLSLSLAPSLAPSLACSGASAPCSASAPLARGSMGPRLIAPNLWSKRTARRDAACCCSLLPSFSNFQTAVGGSLAGFD